MLLHIIARGKIGRSPEAELVARYEKRIAWPFKHSELPETGGKSPDPLTPTRTVLLDAASLPGRPHEQLTASAEALHARTGHTAGNGALMRTSVVGLFALDDREKTAAAARAVAR